MCNDDDNDDDDNHDDGDDNNNLTFFMYMVLCYKSEGRWFDSICCHWNFSLTLNPSDRTMALGSTQPLTEISARGISLGQRRPVRKADNLTTIQCRCHDIWEP